MVLFKSGPQIRQSVLWCPYAGRVVTVELVEVGPPFFRRQVEIRSCSAFEDPSQISCPRRCLDPIFRRDVGRGPLGPITG